MHAGRGSGARQCAPHRRSPRPIRSSTLPSRSSTISGSERSQGCRAAGPRTAPPTSSTPSSTALATTYPNQVVVKDAPYKSIQGRTIKYVEITNNASAVGDGKPVFFNMGAIHGNETAAAEDSLEFAYDVLLQAKTNPKVAALLDKVRLIDLPLTNPDGHAFKNATTGAAAPRRASCGPFSSIVPPATCTTYGRRPQPQLSVRLGLQHRRHAWPRAAPARAPSPRSRTRWTSCSSNQVVTLVTQHTNSRAVFYPGLEIFAGQTPDLNNGYRDLALAMGHATADGYTNVRDSAHDYETSGETIDWSYYATRGIANTLELVGGGAGCPQALPPYQNCTAAGLHRHRRPGLDRRADRPLPGPPGPQRDLAEPRLRVAGRRALADHRQGHPRRDAEDHEGLQPLHGAGADRQHDRRRRQSRPRPVDPAAGDPDPHRVLADGPGLGHVQVGRQPVRPSRPGLSRPTASTPARAASTPESYTLTCTAADGTLLGYDAGARRQGRRGQHLAVHHRRRRRLRAGHARR